MGCFVLDDMKTRLQVYFTAEKLNNSRFERKCGLYNGFVKDLDTKITFESLAKIAFACPNLNLGWLFSGTGEMLINGAKNPGTVIPQSKESSDGATNVNVVRTAGAVIISDVSSLKSIISNAVSQALEDMQ